MTTHPLQLLIEQEYEHHRTIRIMHDYRSQRCACA